MLAREERQSAGLGRVPLKALVPLVILGLLWGSQFALTKIALETVAPASAAAVRISVGCLIIWIVFAWRGLRVPRDLGRWRQFAVHGLLANVGPGLLLAWGQLHVESSLAGILNSTAPIFVFLITWLWTRHEQVDWERVIGVFVGLGGVAVIIGLDALAGLDRGVAGQLAIVAATVGYAVAAIYAHRFSDLPSEVPAACVTTISATVLTAIAFTYDGPALLGASHRSLAALVVTGLFTGLGIVLYFYSIRTIGALATSAASYLKAGFSVLIGCMVLGEPFSGGIAVGLLAVVIGVAAINGQFGGFGGFGGRLR